MGRAGEVATLFARIGLTAFGGPAAHIAMMRVEVVERRGWLTEEEFLDLLGATNLIPGPNSTELAIHIGRRRAGWAGLLVAGIAFILPAATITLGVAWVYVRFGTLPEARDLLYGVKPAVLAVVLQAIASLGKTALRGAPLVVIGLLSLAGAFAGVHELVLLLAAGAGAVAVAIARDRARPIGGAHAASLPLFLLFLKIGSILFGSGYVLLAFLRADLVDRLHWLTERQLVDAIAVGQITPGPVFSTATFIGYLVGGSAGAGLATVGIFLPSFVFVAATSAIVPRIRRSASARAFLDGVNVASLALMTAVGWDLAHAAIVDVPAAAIAVVSAFCLLRLRVSSTWLVAGGAVVGFVVRRALG